MVQLAYAIRVVEPFSLMVNVHSGGRAGERRIEEAVRRIFRLTPKGMIEMLDLRRPIYRKTAAYGHFGRELAEFTWECKDKVRELREFFGYDSLDAPRPE